MKFFIGSSSEHVYIARDVASIIERLSHEPVLWENSFIASDQTFEKLIQICNSVDAGIFILAPDDKIVDSKNGKFITRDNVLIEAGIFSGILGKSRIALCKLPQTEMPTDFSGITFVEYNTDKIYTAQKQIFDWIKALEESIEVKNHTIFLQNNFPNFKNVVLSAHEEIMMSSFFMSIMQTSKELNDVIAQGLNVRFLLPDFWGRNWDATVALLDGVHYSGSRAKMKFGNTLLWIAEEVEKGHISDNLQIRLIDSVLPIRMTIIDPKTQHGHMYVHINSYINRIGENATFHLMKQQPWFETYRKEFEDMWRDARPVDFDEVRSTFDLL